MGWFSRSPDSQREKALRSCPPGPLRDFLGAGFPAPDTPLDELPLLALDIETTGLDPAKDHVLSVGFVPVDGRSIVLAGARHQVIAAGVEVGQSATVHGLTDDALVGGAVLLDAVAEVLASLSGRVLLAHFARIERDFLRAACERAWGARMPCVIVDTFELQRRLLTARWGSEIPDGGLRLWTARRRYGLPVYKAHEALTDALACAELYLAQSAELSAERPLTLAALVS